MNLMIKKVNQYTVISPVGEIDLYTVAQLRKEIYEVIEAGNKSIVFDLSGLEQIDSSGIALFANLQMKLKTYDGRMYLFKVKENMMSVLKLASLDSYFTILNSDEEFLH